MRMVVWVMGRMDSLNKWEMMNVNRNGRNDTELRLAGQRSSRIHLPSQFSQPQPKGMFYEPAHLSSLSV